MIIEPKIDKLEFTVDKRNVPDNKLEDLMFFFDTSEVKYNKSSYYLTVHLNPTKLPRPNLDYDYDNSLCHNLQMNTDVLVNFFEELEKFSISANRLNIRNLHIAKDRVTEHNPDDYNKPLLTNTSQYKGRVRAFEVNNSTHPSVHICNESKSMNRGEWLIKKYNKSSQLKDKLGVYEIIPVDSLSKDDIKILGNGYSKYTGRVNLNKVNLMRMELELKGKQLLLFPHITKRLTVCDILTMIKDHTLTENLNRVFNGRIENTLFPIRKEPTKDSEQDRFNVSDSMYRFDCLFMAMGNYSAYKEYMNSVVSNDDMLLNEIREKFVEM